MPVVCAKDGTASPRATACIFFNFRPDRAREITRTLGGPGFRRLRAQARLLPMPTLCAPPQYDATMPNVQVAFPRRRLHNIFGEYTSASGPDPAAHRRDGEVRPCDLLLQRRRGSRPSPARTACLVASPKVATYDLQPEMSAYEVTRQVRGAHRERQVRRDHPELCQLRHGGPHRRVRGRRQGRGDGGRAAWAAWWTPSAKWAASPSSPPTTATPSRCCSEDGEPLHRPHHQPGALLHRGRRRTSCRDGRLADIAPTMLDLMGLEKPVEMTGESLIG